MSFVTRPILCGGVGCGFEMRSQLPLALDSSARMNTAKAGCLAQWLGDTVGPTEATTDSTSKVVDDSHAEDCKTWLFISGGTSGSDVPPLFFGKGGAVNITKTKEYALAQACWGYRPKCVSGGLVVRLPFDPCVWNSFQSMPVPYLAGMPNVSYWPCGLLSHACR